MADYLKEHHGALWFYMAVPARVRHRFGDTKHIRERLGRFPGGKRDKSARQEALRRAGYYERRFRSLLTLEQTNPEALEGVTDVRKLKGDVAGLEARLPGHLTMEEALALTDRPWIADSARRATEEAELRPIVFQALQDAQRERAQLERLQSIPLATEPDPDHTWAALYDLWRKTKSCKRTNLHERARDLLKEHFGNVDFRKITKAQMKGYRNWLGERVDPKSKRTIPEQMQASLMAAVKGMFSVAVDRLPDMDDSPAAGVSVKVEKKTRDHFTGDQITTILSTVESTRWGAKRHAEVKWLIRLATFQGLRINEIAQLRQADIGMTKESKVPYLHIRQGDGQSLKTGDASARKVPLHPECREFYEWALRPKIGSDGKPTDFVFGAFSLNPTNGRAWWVMNNFKTFRIEKCGITEGKLTAHSLRHSFITARRKAGISEEMGAFLVGHAPRNVEGQYGGTDVDSLYELMKRIDPRTIGD
jgi:integrase